MGRGFARMNADKRQGEGKTGGRGDGETLEHQLREAERRAVLFLDWVGEASLTALGAAKPGGG